MAEPKDILVENLKETLKGAERYFLLGSVSALFILLLALRGQLAAGAVEQEIKVPIVDLSATTFSAAFIALAIYILSGWMILSVASHAKHIKGELTRLEENKLRDAALTYPSMLTPGKYRPMFITLLVAALGTSALLASFYENSGFQKALVVGLIASHAYFIVAIYLCLSPLYEPSKTLPSDDSGK